MLSQHPTRADPGQTDKFSCAWLNAKEIRTHCFFSPKMWLNAREKRTSFLFFLLKNVLHTATVGELITSLHFDMGTGQCLLNIYRAIYRLSCEGMSSICPRGQGSGTMLTFTKQNWVWALLRWDQCVAIWTQLSNRVLQAVSRAPDTCRPSLHNREICRT